MMLALLLSLVQAPAVPPPSAADRRLVDRVLAKAPVIDGHNDLPWEIRDNYAAKVESVDLTRDTSTLPVPLQTDLARFAKGGVGGQFWSLWIPAATTGPRAVEMTLEEIDIVRRMVAANPARMALATTAADVRRVQASGRVAALMGIEGGHQIDGRLSVLRQMEALGVGYMTLTHSKSLDWADSATDTPRSGGLSPFGRQVVAEMNRIGMIVDVSHVSDATMAAVLAIAKAPVIASHSSSRALADAPRNIPDALLRDIGAKGGVVMVNFYPAFLSADWRAWDSARGAYARAQGVAGDLYGRRTPAPLVAWEATHPMPRVTVATVADHVDHVAKVAGHAAVGLGGDYDGISGTAPEGMSGVDGYRPLLEELARRGWREDDLARLTQGNILRVMERVEAVAAGLAGQPPVDATALE